MIKTLSVLAVSGLIFFTSCTKEKITPDTNAPAPLSVNSPFQFTGTLDGMAFSHIDGKNGFTYTPGGLGVPASEPDSSKAIYGAMILNANNEGFTLNKGIRKYLSRDEFDRAQFAGFFAKGGYTFMFAALSSFREDGFELIYRDANGKVWNTYGTYNPGIPGDNDRQVGSTIIIEDIKELQSNWSVGVVVKIRIRCNLNPDDGAGATRKADLTAVLPYVI